MEYEHLVRWYKKYIIYSRHAYIQLNHKELVCNLQYGTRLIFSNSLDLEVKTLKYDSGKGHSWFLLTDIFKNGWPLDSRFRYKMPLILHVSSLCIVKENWKHFHWPSLAFFFRYKWKKLLPVGCLGNSSFPFKEHYLCYMYSWHVCCLDSTNSNKRINPQET